MFFSRKNNFRQLTGRSGEDMAARYLERQGYTIIERNYRKRIGEIDIIARDGEWLVFVEVKTRRSNTYGSPFDAVCVRKQKQVSRLALAFITQHQYNNIPIRFDVIAVHLMGNSTDIELMKNAFEYTC